jgi:hypothetical protein
MNAKVFFRTGLFLFAVLLITTLVNVTFDDTDPCANPNADITAAILADADGDQDALANRAILMRGKCPQEELIEVEEEEEEEQVQPPSMQPVMASAQVITEVTTPPVTVSTNTAKRSSTIDVLSVTAAMTPPASSSSKPTQALREAPAKTSFMTAAGCARATSPAYSMMHSASNAGVTRVSIRYWIKSSLSVV